MRRTNVLLFVALLAAGIMRAQTPAAPGTTPNQDPSQAPKKAPTPLPVPGGGATLGSEGLGQPNDHPTLTKDEALKNAKAQGDQIADFQARRIAVQLRLTSGQFNQVRAILVEREDLLRKAYSSDASEAGQHPLTPQERQLKTQELRDAAMKKIEAVLNPVQKQQFDTLLTHHSAERARRAAATRRPATHATTPADATPAPAAQQTPAASTTSAAPATPPQSKQ